jgi:hypothetical protein
MSADLYKEMSTKSNDISLLSGGDRGIEVWEVVIRYWIFDEA